MARRQSNTVHVLVAVGLLMGCAREPVQSDTVGDARIRAIKVLVAHSRDEKGPCVRLNEEMLAVVERLGDITEQAHLQRRALKQMAAELSPLADGRAAEAIVAAKGFVSSEHAGVQQLADACLQAGNLVTELNDVVALRVMCLGGTSDRQVAQKCRQAKKGLTRRTGELVLEIPATNERLFQAYMTLLDER